MLHPGRRIGFAAACVGVVAHSLEPARLGLVGFTPAGCCDLVQTVRRARGGAHLACELRFKSIAFSCDRREMVRVVAERAAMPKLVLPPARLAIEFVRRSVIVARDVCAKVDRLSRNNWQRFFF